jgi:hypothetical protein
VIESRDSPRTSFAGHVNETPWDQLHAAYFNGYALWTYLTQPFLYAYPGFVTDEIEPWEENGETWRRLKVIFPDNIASHAREQITYFGADGLMRRHDYAVDVLPAPTISTTITRSAGSWCPPSAGLSSWRRQPAGARARACVYRHHSHRLPILSTYASPETNRSLRRCRVWLVKQKLTARKVPT